MLRMSKQADYAIVLLSHFASENPGAHHSARDLAEVASLPAPTVSKILKALTRAGLLESTRGAKGGYRLARAAERISLAEAIAAVEGPISVTDCCPDSAAACEHEPSCPARGPLQQVNRILQQSLERVPLSRIVPSEHPLELDPLTESPQLPLRV